MGNRFEEPQLWGNSFGQQLWGAAFGSNFGAQLSGAALQNGFGEPFWRTGLQNPSFEATALENSFGAQLLGEQRRRGTALETSFGGQLCTAALKNCSFGEHLWGVYFRTQLWGAAFGGNFGEQLSGAALENSFGECFVKQV